jgi:tRNA(Arg) A34 adenosine deaminase TadA
MSDSFPEPEVLERLLARAIELSGEKMRQGFGGPFGAVIARGDQILAEGWNCVTSSFDPTAHAEVMAIRAASKAISDFDLRGAVIYSSCEPCPMCLGAIYWARLDGLVFANTRHEAASIGFDDEHFYDQMSLPVGMQRLPSQHIVSEEARAIFEEWRNKTDRIDY